MNDFDLLTGYSTGSHFIIVDQAEELRIYVDNRTIEPKSRDHALIILAMLGRLPFGVTLDKCLEIADEIWEEASIPENPGLCYRGCHFGVFFHRRTGKFELELEPGFGTTVARMQFSDAGSVYSALMGILICLRKGYFKTA